MAKSTRFWMLWGIFSAYVVLLGAAYLSIAMDGFAGGSSTNNSAWPTAMVGVAAVIIWLLSERIDGAIVGAVTGFALIGLAYLALIAITYTSSLVQLSVVLSVGVLCMIFALTTALTGSFRLFHRGLAWVGLTTLLLITGATCYAVAASGILRETLLALFLPLPPLLCLYPVILCSFWVQPKE